MSSAEFLQVPATAEKDRPLTINELIAKLAEDMRTFDALKIEKADLLAEEEPLDLKLPFDVIESAIAIRDTEIALLALQREGIRGRLVSLNQQIAPLDGATSDLETYKRKWQKVEIVSLYPDEHDLGRFAPDGGGFMGGKRTEVTGRLMTLNLGAREGGFIRVKGRTWEYEGSPLVDREKDYTPAFRVTEL